MKIDFDGITGRIIKLPVSTGYYWGGFYANGDKVYYNKQGASMVYDLKAQKEETVADGGGANIYISNTDKKALFFKGGQLYVTNIPSGKQI